MTLNVINYVVLIYNNSISRVIDVCIIQLIYPKERCHHVVAIKIVNVICERLFFINVPDLHQHNVLQGAGTAHTSGASEHLGSPKCF